MIRHDIAIAGGGPAGAVAALLFARQGARVALVDRDCDRPRIEGLSPRVLAVLGRLGLDPAEARLPVTAPGIAAPLVTPAIPRAARWGTLDAAPNREHLTERAAFDRWLRACAASEGVTLVRCAIERVEPGAVHTRRGTVAAGLVIEARGRRAPVADGRLRGPATIALAGFTTGADLAQASISAREHGWVWRAAFGGRVWTQVVADASAARRGLSEAWARVLPRTPMPERPLVRAAELRLTAPGLDPALPRLGDAAIAMDPLSGHGVFWALSSALAAPPLVSAILAGDHDLACRFHRERLARTFWRQARIGRDFHALAGHGTPFWLGRGRWPDEEPAHGAQEAPRIERRVIVRDGRLAEAEVLLTAEEPDGVAFVAGEPVVPLIRSLSPGTAREDFPALLPHRRPGHALAIHDWLARRALLGTEIPTSTEVTP